MSKNECSYEGCTKESRARTVCGQHYMVLKRTEKLPEARNVYHGLSYSPEYKVWANMISRCYRPSYRSYHRYGGRGITVCDRWRYSFSNFHDDMGDRPTASYSLDRIKLDGNYESSNCKWATRSQQARNTSTNRYITYLGETLTVIEWAEKLNVNPITLHTRLHFGWSAERTLSTPIIHRNRNVV